MEIPLNTEMICYSTESDHDIEHKPSPMLVDPIYISSDEDEDMSTYLSGTVSEEEDLADDEDSLADEIQSMSVHVETAMFAPIPVRPAFAQAAVILPSTPRRQRTLRINGLKFSDRTICRGPVTEGRKLPFSIQTSTPSRGTWKKYDRVQ